MTGGSDCKISKDALYYGGRDLQMSLDVCCKGWRAILRAGLKLKKDVIRIDYMFVSFVFDKNWKGQVN